MSFLSKKVKISRLLCPELLNGDVPTQTKIDEIFGSQKYIPMRLDEPISFRWGFLPIIDDNAPILDRDVPLMVPGYSCAFVMCAQKRVPKHLIQSELMQLAPEERSEREPELTESLLRRALPSLKTHIICINESTGEIITDIRPGMLLDSVMAHIANITGGLRFTVSPHLSADKSLPQFLKELTSCQSYDLDEDYVAVLNQGIMGKLSIDPPFTSVRAVGVNAFHTVPNYTKIVQAMSEISEVRMSLNGIYDSFTISLSSKGSIGLTLPPAEGDDLDSRLIHRLDAISKCLRLLDNLVDIVLTQGGV
jgi:hypothetical protein